MSGSLFGRRNLCKDCGDIMELTNRTIGQCLYKQAERTGEHVAVEMEGWRCTFRQLDVVSDLLAGRMKKLEIVRGTHVCQLSRLDYYISGIDEDWGGASPDQHLLWRG